MIERRPADHAFPMDEGFSLHGPGVVDACAGRLAAAGRPAGGSP